MLFEAAVGNAYGTGWTFPDGPTTQHDTNDLSGYRVSPMYPERPAGRYTAATLRLIANARVVVSPRAEWFDPTAYVREYQRIQAKDPRQGWSRGFQEQLDRYGDASPLQCMLGLRRRATSGAVTGAAPLGFLPDENAVRLAATAQCVSTHSGAAVSSAQAVALAAHYLLHDKGPRHRLEDYLEQEVDWASREECLQILCKGTAAVPVPHMTAWTITAGAIFIAADGDFTGMADRLRFAIRRGGNTGSLGAVTMALCSCTESIPDDLPPSLMQNLEDEAGREILHDLDRQLRAFAGLQSGPTERKR